MNATLTFGRDQPSHGCKHPILPHPKTVDRFGGLRVVLKFLSSWGPRICFRGLFCVQ